MSLEFPTLNKNLKYEKINFIFIFISFVSFLINWFVTQTTFDSLPFLLPAFSFIYIRMDVRGPLCSHKSVLPIT